MSLALAWLGSAWLVAVRALGPMALCPCLSKIVDRVVILIAMVWPGRIHPHRVALVWMTREPWEGEVLCSGAVP